MVAKCRASIQARVGQLHSLNLQLPTADPSVFAIYKNNMVFGPIHSLKGILEGAAQIQAIPRIEGEQLGFRRDYKEKQTFISDFLIIRDTVCVTLIIHSKSLKQTGIFLLKEEKQHPCVVQTVIQFL